MSATGALARSRAAADCGNTVGHRRGCPALEAHETGTDPFETFGTDWHDEFASALLDGFSVEELTAVGG